MSAGNDITVGLKCPYCEYYLLVKSCDIPVSKTVVCMSCKSPFNARETIVRDVMAMLDKYM